VIRSARWSLVRARRSPDSLAGFRRFQRRRLRPHTRPLSRNSRKPRSTTAPAARPLRAISTCGGNLRGAPVCAAVLAITTEVDGEAGLQGQRVNGLDVPTWSGSRLPAARIVEADPKALRAPAASRNGKRAAHTHLPAFAEWTRTVELSGCKTVRPDRGETRRKQSRGCFCIKSILCPATTAVRTNAIRWSKAPWTPICVLTCNWHNGVDR